MRRVVVTGMGIWSCIGQDLQTVTESLRQGRSGIVFDPKRIEYGLQSGLVGNVPRPDLKPLLPRKFRATMSEDYKTATITPGTVTSGGAPATFHCIRWYGRYTKADGSRSGVSWTGTDTAIPATMTKVTE